MSSNSLNNGIDFIFGASYGIVLKKSSGLGIGLWINFRGKEDHKARFAFSAGLLLTQISQVEKRFLMEDTVKKHIVPFPNIVFTIAPGKKPNFAILQFYIGYYVTKILKSKLVFGLSAGYSFVK